MLKTIAILASIISVALIAFFICFLRFGPVIIAAPAVFIGVCSAFLGIALRDQYPRFGTRLFFTSMALITVTLMTFYLPTVLPGPVAYGKVKLAQLNRWFLDAAERETAQNRPVVEAAPMPASAPSPVPIRIAMPTPMPTAQATPPIVSDEPTVTIYIDPS